MCFDGGERTIKTKTYMKNDRVYYEESPRVGASWGRRYGLGGSYYPSRYYVRPPTRRYAVTAMTHPIRFPHSPGVAGGVNLNGYGHSRGYHGHHLVGAPATLGGNAANVSFCSFPFYSDRFLLFYPAFISRSDAHERVEVVSCSDSISQLCPRACLIAGLSPTFTPPALAPLYYHQHLLHFFPLPQFVNTIMESLPKPRHNYIYTPRYGQRGILTYAGQQPNGAYPAGVIPNAYYGIGGIVGGYATGAYYPGVYHSPSYYAPVNYQHYPMHHYGGYYNYRLYGSLYPLANFYSPYQRSYYNSMPSYGYHQAHVYPPGPSATTTTTTYHVTNSHAAPAYATPIRETHTTTCNHGPATREDIQMENRRVATERGAYHPRRIKPADARHDDPFWCRERNGEWHLRTFYQIENECHPGRWLMDAEVGFLVFHRE